MSAMYLRSQHAFMMRCFNKHAADFTFPSYNRHSEDYSERLRYLASNINYNQNLIKSTPFATQPRARMRKRGKQTELLHKTA